MSFEGNEGGEDIIDVEILLRCMSLRLTTWMTASLTSVSKCVMDVIHALDRAGQNIECNGVLVGRGQAGSS